MGIGCREHTRRGESTDKFLNLERAVSFQKLKKSQCGQRAILEGENVREEIRRGREDHAGLIGQARSWILRHYDSKLLNVL